MKDMHDTAAEAPEGTNPAGELIKLCDHMIDGLESAADLFRITSEVAANELGCTRLAEAMGEAQAAVNTDEALAEICRANASYAARYAAGIVATRDRLETLRDQLSAAREEAPRRRSSLTLMAEPRTFDGFTGAAAVRRLMKRAEDQAGAVKRRRMFTEAKCFIPTIGDERIETLPTSTEADALTIAGLLIQEARAWKDAHCRP